MGHHDLGGCRGSTSGKCYIELAMTKDWILQINPHYSQVLTLRLVDGEGKSQLNGELLPSELEWSAITCSRVKRNPGDKNRVT